MLELSKMDNPAIRKFFDGPRGRAAHEQEHEQEQKQKQKNPQGKVQTSNAIGRPSSKPK